VTTSGARVRRLVSLIRKERYCPFCGWRGYRFEPFGNRVLHRNDALCPLCGSLERHRLAYLLLKDRIGRGQKVLHAAPEPLMIPWLVGMSCEYLNVDLLRPAMRRMDLTDIDLPDASKTLVWCSHVLEHIPDDRKALTQMFRILEPGGTLILQVPIGGETTYENPTLQSDADRLVHFLQEDHVRLYGLDLKQRIETAGFACQVLSSDDLPKDLRARCAVDATYFSEVFLCRKPEAAANPTTAAVAQAGSG